MDTTSNAISRVLWILSRNIDVQTKLREEIRNAYEGFGGDKLGYDELMGRLPYLDAVCRETLRVFVTIPLASLSDA